MYQVQARYEFYIIVGNYIRLPGDLAIWIAQLNCIFPLELGWINISTVGGATTHSLIEGYGRVGETIGVQLIHQFSGLILLLILISILQFMEIRGDIIFS